MYTVFILYGAFSAFCLLILAWILSYETDKYEEILREDNAHRKTYLDGDLKIIRKER